MNAKIQGFLVYVTLARPKEILCPLKSNLFRYLASMFFFLQIMMQDEYVDRT